MTPLGSLEPAPLEGESPNNTGKMQFLVWLLLFGVVSSDHVSEIVVKSFLHIQTTIYFVKIGVRLDTAPQPQAQSRARKMKAKAST